MECGIPESEASELPGGRVAIAAAGDAGRDELVLKEVLVEEV